MYLGSRSLEKYSFDSVCFVDYSSSCFFSFEYFIEDFESMEFFSVDGIFLDFEELVEGDEEEEEEEGGMGFYGL